VIETLGLARTPAGLWASSFLFSWLSRDLCARIADAAGDPSAIISPCFTEEESLKLKDGVGLFPDRIIAQTALSLDQINTIIAEAKQSLAETLFEAVGDAGAAAADLGTYQNYFGALLRVRAVEFRTDGNPVLESSQLLSAIELEPQFSQAEPRNYLLELFESPKAISQNTNVKDTVWKSFGIGDSWQLLSGASANDGPHGPPIRDLAHIARGGAPATSEYKRSRYYAIVQCDGDNVGLLLERVGRFLEGRVQGKPGSDVSAILRDQFSKKLLEYSQRAAQIVKNYGGVTLYAGGDDLLAITPVFTADGQTILDLAQSLNTEFQGALDLTQALEPEFQDMALRTPTLSIGVAICYYKYPLYEALALARSMLFDHAKHATLGDEGPVKDALAVSLVKHSGHAAAFVLPKFSQTAVVERLEDLIAWQGDQRYDNPVRYYNSVEQHLSDLSPLFAEAMRTAKGAEDLAPLFGNVFDSSFHGPQLQPQLDSVRELLWLSKDHARSIDGSPPSADPAGSIDHSTAIHPLLQFVRFFSEKNKDD
jgi:CRISPR-associated protein Cmr2